ncbi:hypothetical protein J7K74_02520 [Candidatus Woesearchaeota archaeon]|nr:hypothetical protein [Candidatus Woesearchaeota archaeon]
MKKSKGKKEVLISIIFLALLLGIIHFSVYPSVIYPWTDEIIYVGMAKYFTGSLGPSISGFYELMRPPLLSFFYSPLYLLGIVREVDINNLEGLNIETFRIPLYTYNYLLNLASIVVIFSLILFLGGYKEKKIKEKRLLLLSAILVLIYFMFNKIYINYGERILPDPLSEGLTLLALLLIAINKPLTKTSKKSYMTMFVSGVLFGLAFLTRFNQLLLFMAFILLLLLEVFILLMQNKKKKATRILLLIIALLLGFTIPFMLYSLFLRSIHASIFEVLEKASEVVRQDSSLFPGSPIYYLKELILTVPGIFLLLIFGIFHKTNIKEKKWAEKRIIIQAISLYVLILLIYLSFFFPLKIYRYLFSILPGIIVLSGIIMYEILKNIKRSVVYKIFFALFSLLLIVNIISSAMIIRWHTVKNEDYIKDIEFIVQSLKSMNISSENYVIFTNKVELGMYLKNTVIYIRWWCQKRALELILNNSKEIEGYAELYPLLDIHSGYKVVPIIDYSIPVLADEEEKRQEIKEFLEKKFGVYAYSGNIYVYNPR